MLVMELLTVKEVAQKLRMSPEAVRRLLRSKELSGYTIQGEWRIRPEHLEEYLARQLNTNKPEQES